MKKAMDKKVTIKVNKTELDAIEDYFTVDFERNYAEEERCRQAVKKIWKKLIKEWDKK